MSDLTLVYFAWVREAIGRDEEQVERPAADVTIAALITTLATRGAGYAEAFARPEKLRAAQEAAAAISPAPHVPRDRKPLPPVSQEPLIQVETRR